MSAIWIFIVRRLHVQCPPLAFSSFAMRVANASRSYVQLSPCEIPIAHLISAVYISNFHSPHPLPASTHTLPSSAQSAPSSLVSGKTVRKLAFETSWKFIPKILRCLTDEAGPSCAIFLRGFLVACSWCRTKQGALRFTCATLKACKVRQTSHRS